MMNKIKFLLCFLITLQLACAVAPKPCTVKLENSPELRGFRLGMSLQEIQKRFPNFPQIAANQDGLAVVQINNGYARTVLNSNDGANVVSLIPASPYSELKDLKHLELKLVDEKLVKVTAFYPNDLEWKSADEFAQRTGESLKLDGGWEKLNEDSQFFQRRHMSCDNFEVSAGFDTNPYAFPESKTDSTFDKPKLPYIELQNFRAEFEATSRRLDRARNANAKQEEQKQVFKP